MEDYKKLEALPILYFDVGKDDREAIGALADSNIKCKFKGPIGDMDTPILYHKDKQYIGLSAIKLFIERYKENEV